MEYLLKASAVIAVFYMFYKLLLQRDTFFRCNRWFLLVGLLVSLTIPMVVIPIYIEYIPVDVSNFTFENATNPANSGLEMSDYVMIVYGLGVTFFFTRFLIQVTSLALVIMRHKKDKRGKYTYVKTQANISPFSFFRWIVFNPEKFNNTELKQIIAHEKVHVNQYHSMDILLTHLACIVLWVNPFIWLYKKDLKQNLEFLADHDTVNNAVCKKAYQYTLLKTSAPSHQLALSNNFYNSLIKKRIVMLQKSKSKKINQFKYALVIPLLAIFIFNFNTKVIAQNKNKDENINITSKSDAGDSENPLIIVDGKECERSEMDKINPDNIESIDVLKGESATTKYGDKGKNGVILITTKENNNVIYATKDPISANKRPNVFRKVVNDFEKQPLIILDGEEFPHEKMESINTENIEYIFILKGEKAIEKYGDKGVNGVILITTNKK